jgi:hypothetical protein
MTKLGESCSRDSRTNEAVRRQNVERVVSATLKENQAVHRQSWEYGVSLLSEES